MDVLQGHENIPCCSDQAKDRIKEVCRDHGDLRSLLPPALLSPIKVAWREFYNAKSRHPSL